MNNRQRRTGRNATETLEPETYFSKEQDALGGRFAELNNQRLIASGSSYPKVDGPLTRPQPDHGYAPDRDRIEPEHVTPPEFGIACGGAAIQPLESTPISSQATLAEDVEQPTAPSSANFRRGL